MFDIGWSELLLIGVVALIAIGPKELPGVLRAIGQWTAKIRRMAGEFQGQFQEALREAEMADLKKQVDDINESARAFAKFDPLAEAAKTATPAVTPSPSETTPTQAIASDVAPGDVTPGEAKPSEAAALPPPVSEPTPVPAATTEPVSAAAAPPVETPPPAATPTIETTPATEPASSAETAPAPPAPGERPA
ncbi:twin-arginine translocase subunit TatB [Rhodoplanes serenus]|uniref:Sec-independent protein translocase protein TatB n=1 Tax=Rhodoplanes serenus TaxID=200615 RepID=A0A9X5ASA0_9BRAD|nr:Sec-independent protein translocase protein TatB [Rhodoplanes serenus]MTW16144.1 twin-arginine translocase subunit TatB [Rhodoplanes serenus]